jgi:cystathionine beta-lyase/cystathionine gamma-synthase
MKIAKFLSKHEKVETVYYPGLPTDPGHEIARKQMKGFGGMLSFELKSDFDGTKLFIDKLGIIKIATSLGGVSTLATQPITNTHAGLSAEERKKSGISDSLVRISVGIENPDLIIDDINQALAAFI